jgi:hypothetical protein
LTTSNGAFSPADAAVAKPSANAPANPTIRKAFIPILLSCETTLRGYNPELTNGAPGKRRLFKMISDFFDG